MVVSPSERTDIENERGTDYQVNYQEYYINVFHKYPRLGKALIISFQKPGSTNLPVYKNEKKIPFYITVTEINFVRYKQLKPVS